MWCSRKTVLLFALVTVLLLSGCVRVTYEVAVRVAPETAGTVTGYGTYKKGDTVVLSAFAAAGYRFFAWKSGDDFLSADNPYSFKILKNTSLKAVFVLNKGKLSIADSTLVAGEEGLLNVRAAGLGKVSLIEVVLQYDPAMFSWEGSSSRITGWLTIEKNPRPGIIHVAISGKAVQLDEARDVIRFFVVPAAAGESEIGFSSYTSEGGVFFETSYIDEGGTRTIFPELELLEGTIVVR